MSMYEIKRWDVILDENNNKIPMIYIEPDIYFLEFARINEYSIFCEINDTYSVYDKSITKGSINNANMYCRPNFFISNNLYVISLLDFKWNGYPTKLGNIKFYGYKNN